MTFAVQQFFSLLELSDVQASTPSDGDGLQWSAVDGAWIVAPVSGGSGPPYDSVTDTLTVDRINLTTGGNTSIRGFAGFFSSLYVEETPVFVWYKNGVTPSVWFQGATQCSGQVLLLTGSTGGGIDFGGGTVSTVSTGASIFVAGMKRGVDQAAAGAAANEVYVDTTDNALKVGI